MGGVRGFGAVVIDDDEPVFEAEWEGRLFGLVMTILNTGLVTRVDEFRTQLESLAPDTYLSTSYFGRWAVAVEAVLVSHGVLTSEQIGDDVPARRRAGVSASTHDVDAVVEQALIGRPTALDLDRPPRFQLGDDVIARNDDPPGHTRLARYVRGRRGAIERQYAAFPYPESAAQGAIAPEYVYAVRFEAAALWGASAEPHASVCIDLFEPYLEPV